MHPKEIEEKILSLLRNHGHKSFRPKEIAKRLALFDNTDYRTFREILGQMATDGKIAQIKGGRYTLKRRPKKATGILQISSRGYGIVTLDEDESEVFVRPFDLSTALDGDQVEVSLGRPASGDRRREAVVDRVIVRRHKHTVGTYESYGETGLVTTDDTRFLHDVRIPKGANAGAVSGDKVQVEIVRFDDPDRLPEGKVVELIGRSGEKGVAETALALSLDIPIEFPKEVLTAAEEIPAAIRPEDLEDREDFRAYDVFTIDPADARDFDDAIHVREVDGLFEVGVHIADVAHYVQESSRVDDEAKERGTSVYMVEQVYPMLPERLSNEICSLQPDTDRLTVSCVVRLTSEGEVRDFRLTNSIIRSAARMSYEEAEQLLEGTVDHPLATDIRHAGALAKKLTDARFREGSVDFDTPESRVVLDEEGEPVDIVPRPRLASHRLIEEFMLLANRLVADHMTADGDAGPPFVYRVHESPDRDRIAALSTYVGIFGYELPHDRGSVDVGALNKLLKETRGTPRGAVISMAALRSMAKARYGTKNFGHFGLGFDRYTHFTSPIRRYPDLIVHRLLKRRMQKLPPAVDRGKLEELCKHASEQERKAEEAERESVKLKKARFMQAHIGEQFGAFVTGATPFGVFVEIEQWMVEGLVHVRDMDDFYEYDENQYALIGSRGKKIAVGDAVEVIVVDADEQTREIDFVFAPGQGY